MALIPSNCLLNTPTQPLSHTICTSSWANITIVPSGPSEGTSIISMHSQSATVETRGPQRGHKGAPFFIRFYNGNFT